MSLHLWEKSSPKWYSVIFAVLAIIAGAAIGVSVAGGVNPTWLIAIVLGLILAVMTISNLEFGLLVFIVLTYLRVSDIAVHEYGAPSIARIFIGLLVGALVLRWAVTNEFPRGWVKPAVLVIAYGIVIFGSILYANDFASAQAAAADYWKDGLITVLVVALLQNRRTFRAVIWALILAGIFVASISVYQYLTGTFDNNYWGFAEAPLQNIVGETEGNRVAGPIGDPNFYAQILVVLVPLAINRMVNEKKVFLKILAGYGAVVITLAIFYTFSRGGLVALLGALVALAFYRPPKLRVVIVMVAVMWVVVLLMPDLFMERMRTVTDVITGKGDVQSEVSMRGRSSEMLSAWYMFVDHPILGVGANNYPINYQTYSRKLGLDNRATLREPHNLFIQVAAETGILGILIFGFILYYIFRCLFVTRRAFSEEGDREYFDLVGAFSAALIGYLIAAMFIHGAYPRYFWLLAGIGMALPQIVKHQDHIYEGKGLRSH